MRAGFCRDAVPLSGECQSSRHTDPPALWARGGAGRARRKEGGLVWFQTKGRRLNAQSKWGPHGLGWNQTRSSAEIGINNNRVSLLRYPNGWGPGSRRRGDASIPETRRQAFGKTGGFHVSLLSTSDDVCARTHAPAAKGSLVDCPPRTR